MADTVSYETTGRLGVLTLNRPAALNALDVPTKEALRTALERAARNPDIGALLLTGAGRAFCVGQDLKEHAAELADTDGGAALDTVAEHYSPITELIATMPKPVVAGVNGLAAGAGLGFALAADYRIVAESATFTTAFTAIGLAADSGLSWTLPRVVGPARAADLLFFPRSIGAAEAEQLGIAQRVVPDDELATVAREAAGQLAAGPTVAYAAVKEALTHGASHSLPETLRREAELQVRAGASEDHQAAVTAFLAKEKPRFIGR